MALKAQLSSGYSMRYRHLTTRLLVVLSMLVILTASGASAQPQATNTVYLPSINAPATTPLFGFETNLGQLHNPNVRARAAALGATWVRINGVRWHMVQPEQGGPYNWDALTPLSRDLAAAQALGLTPTVVIQGAPLWAAVTNSNCAAVRDDQLGAYVAFLEALATRYRDRVDYWELGNEPDVDPTLVGSTSPYGCQGNIADAYYGGERYGRMLQVAAPALRRGNPNATIIFGGLLLDMPNTTNPDLGTPERFLEGALMSGAANSFDVLAIHSYPPFLRAGLDHDLEIDGRWASRGGWTLGKANFVRETMGRYGVSKPLWINEISLLNYACESAPQQCPPPPADFLQAQAEHLVRIILRAATNNVQMVAWYPLNYANWLDASLLGPNQVPRPSYNAYKHLIQTTAPYRSVTPVTDYGPEIEAYRFDRGDKLVDVLWRRTPGTTQISVLQSHYRASTSLYGENNVSGEFNARGDALLNIGFTPVYIERRP